MYQSRKSTAKVYHPSWVRWTCFVLALWGQRQEDQELRPSVVCMVVLPLPPQRFVTTVRGVELRV